MGCAFLFFCGGGVCSSWNSGWISGGGGASGNWNIFRRRRWLVSRRLVERSLDCSRRDIGGIDWRRFFVEGKCNRDSMHEQSAADSREHLPLRSGFE